MPRAAADKNASQKTGRSSSASRVAKSTARKAPTRPAPTPKRPDRTRLKFVLSLVFAAVVISGTSIAIGMSDGGQIDIAGAIINRANELEEQGDTEGSARARGVSAPTGQSNQPNGGLVGRGNKVTEEQRLKGQVRGVQDTSQTASTTQETATSTESEDLEAGAVEDSSVSSDGEGTENTETTSEQSATEGDTTEDLPPSAGEAQGE